MPIIIKIWVYKLHNHELETIPISDLSKLRNVVDNDVVKKNPHDELVKKLKSIHAIIDTWLQQMKQRYGRQNS